MIWVYVGHDLIQSNSWQFWHFLLKALILSVQASAESNGTVKIEMSTTELHVNIQFIVADMNVSGLHMCRQLQE